jgi:cell fate regulator YaaT (PSP1 superfamily)
MTDKTTDDQKSAGAMAPGSRRPAAVGVSFRRTGKLYYFKPTEAKLATDDYVIVRTEKGVDIAKVVELVFDAANIHTDTALKPLLRRATDDDLQHEHELRDKEQNALRTCEKMIADHDLPMKLIDADYTFDARCLVIFFSAEGRVDFRALVKDLARTFRTRIELRQIGVRDEAKMLGGIGSCGRPLCCQTFLRNFQPVGIRVAKDQGISLNPSKISGVCDRLMCCLRFEHQQYLDMAKELPDEGDIVTTPQGEGRVVDCHVVAEEVVVKLDPETLITIPAASVKPKTDTATKSKRRRNRPTGRRKRR